MCLVYGWIYVSGCMYENKYNRWYNPRQQGEDCVGRGRDSGPASKWRFKEHHLMVWNMIMKQLMIN